MIKWVSCYHRFCGISILLVYSMGIISISATFFFYHVHWINRGPLLLPLWGTQSIAGYCIYLFLPRSCFFEHAPRPHGRTHAHAHAHADAQICFLKLLEMAHAAAARNCRSRTLVEGCERWRTPKRRPANTSPPPHPQNVKREPFAMHSGGNLSYKQGYDQITKDARINIQIPLICCKTFFCLYKHQFSVCSCNH